jgi:hypothetical protein
MYASDYPHGESHFPESAGLDARLGNGQGTPTQIAVENAARLYARARLGSAQTLSSSGAVAPRFSIDSGDRIAPKGANPC